jgi:hypothetical protein
MKVARVHSHTPITLRANNHDANYRGGGREGTAAGRELPRHIPVSLQISYDSNGLMHFQRLLRQGNLSLALQTLTGIAPAVQLIYLTSGEQLREDNAEELLGSPDLVSSSPFSPRVK